MENCYVKQYVDSVDNSNLPVFQVFDVVVTDGAAATNENYRMYIQRKDASLTATIIGDGSFRSDDSMESVIADKTINPNGFVRFTPGNYIIRFSNKYDAFQTSFHTPLSCSFDLENIKWNPDITDLEINVPCDWNDIALYANKTGLSELYGAPNTEVNLNKFNEFTELLVIQVLNGMLVGDIKDWVVTQVNAGRTTNSGGTNFKYCPGLKFNGTNITSKSPNKVMWTPTTGGTSITMDGVTIVVDSSGNVIG